MKNQISKENLTRLKGEYQAKYGLEMDDWLTTILYELEEKMEQHKQKVEQLILHLEKVASFVRGETKSVHFSNNKQAFWFGFGKSLPICFGILAISILGYFIIMDTNEFRARKKFIAEHRNYSSYKLLMESGQIIRQENREYLALKLVGKGGDVIIGKEYELDSKNKRILVPLGRF